MSSGGSPYSPPLNNNLVYNNTNFNYQNSTSSTALQKQYTKYPITQGGLTINGTLSLTKPITLPSTYTSPIIGQMGYTYIGTNNTVSYTSNVTSNVSSLLLPSGVYIINYGLSVVPSGGSITNIIATIGTNSTQTINNPYSSTMGQNTSSTIYISDSIVLTIPSSITYYLNITPTFAAGSVSTTNTNVLFQATKIL